MSFPSVALTVSGITRLEGNSTESECVALTQRRQCIEGAGDLLQRAITEEPGNPLAHLGVGLIALRQAIDAAAKGAPASLVESAFVRGADHLRVAKLHSSFIDERLAQADWLQHFDLLGLQTDLDGDVADLAKRFACTSAAHRRGSMDAVLRHGDGLEDDLPVSLVPYVLARLYDARMSQVSKADALQDFMNAAEEHLDGEPSSQELARVFARHQCRYPDTRERGRATLADLLTQQDYPPARLDTELALLDCDGDLDTEEFLTQAADLNGRVDMLPEGEERGLLHFEMGLVLLQRGETESGFGALKTAFKELPYAMSRLISESKRPEVKALLSDGQRFQQLIVLSETAPGTDLYEDIPCDSPPS